MLIRGISHRSRLTRPSDAPRVGCRAWTSSPVGIRRVTLPLPTRPGHVHAYLLPGDDGWTLVDTGLGLPDARERWAAELDGLPGAVARIFVTHFHPDHVGAARRRRRAHGAPVLQGALDYEQCSLVWGGEDWVGRPRRLVPPSRRPRRGDRRARSSRGRCTGRSSASSPTPSRSSPATSSTAGRWSRARARGRPADAAPRRRARGGRSPPRPISPTVGLWPESRPDPLGDYLAALEATIALEPTLASAGPRRADRGPRRAGARSSSTTTASGSTRPRRRSATEPSTGYAGLVRALRRRPEARRAPLRGRRDALAPRAPRPRRRAPVATRPTDGVTYTSA